MAQEVSNGTWDPSDRSTVRKIDRDFARRVGRHGWIGITWPTEYGGGGKTFLERYVLQEEMIVAQAPATSFSTADRQSGPILLKYANEAIKREIIPKIVSGDVSFCIGMSEPNSGSDLFAASARAKRVEGGYVVRGTKIWTSYAHECQYMIGLFRTADATETDRRHGLSQFLVDLSLPGISVNPIVDLSDKHSFNEVVFDDVFLPEDRLIGIENEAWKQATSELAYERAGPDRFLETVFVLFALVEVLGSSPAAREAEGIGRLVAQLHTLRRMSVSVSGMLANGAEPTLQGSIVKNLGTIWEQELPEKARELAAFVDRSTATYQKFEHALRDATLIAPKLTIQGGATEILRGIIARALGLR